MEKRGRRQRSRVYLVQHVDDSSEPSQGDGEGAQGQVEEQSPIMEAQRQPQYEGVTVRDRD